MRIGDEALIDRLPTHHDPLPSLKGSPRRKHDSSIITRTFSTASVIDGAKTATAFESGAP
jgi:hypothetical protein